MTLSCTRLTRLAATAAAGTALAIGAAADADARSPKHRIAKRMLKEARLDLKPPRTHAIRADLDGDGDVDRIFVLSDTDGDGKIDTVMVDVDADGDLDYGALDGNRDGRFDARWVDKDGDGRTDDNEIEEIESSSQASRTGTRGKVHKVRFDRCLSVKRVRRCLVHSPHRVFGLRANRFRFVPLPLPVPPAPQQPAPPAQQPEPQPQPQPKPAPVPFGTFDADGDGEKETAIGDPTVASPRSRATYDDGDLDADGVEVGTLGGVTLGGVHNIDNDPKDDELVLLDPTLPPGQVREFDVEPDHDADVIFVGVMGGVEFGGVDDIDNDPTEKEIILYDPNLAVGQIRIYHLDTDGDPDVKVIGTKVP
jgi:hypothetical protein